MAKRKTEAEIQAECQAALDAAEAELDRATGAAEDKFDAAWDKFDRAHQAAKAERDRQLAALDKGGK